MGVTINNETNTLERTAAKATGGGGPKCILLVPNLRPNSAVVEVRKSLASMEDS